MYKYIFSLMYMNLLNSPEGTFPFFFFCMVRFVVDGFYRQLCTKTDRLLNQMNEYYLVKCIG